jgi:hypothetical protein
MKNKEIAAIREARLYLDLARAALLDAIREAARIQRKRRRRKR